MDLGTLRIIVTVAAMAAFLAVVWWAYAPSRRKYWDAKAILDESDS
jgi:cbb3-type cytochrome oxidase subunit 3